MNISPTLMSQMMAACFESIINQNAATSSPNPSQPSTPLPGSNVPSGVGGSNAPQSTSSSFNNLNPLNSLNTLNSSNSLTPLNPPNQVSSF